MYDLCHVILLDFIDELINFMELLNIIFLRGIILQRCFEMVLRSRRIRLLDLLYFLILFVKEFFIILMYSFNVFSKKFNLLIPLLNFRLHFKLVFLKSLFIQLDLIQENQFLFFLTLFYRFELTNLHSHLFFQIQNILLTLLILVLLVNKLLNGLFLFLYNLMEIHLAQQTFIQF